VLIDNTATATNRFNQRKFHILDGDAAAAASTSIQCNDGAAPGRCRGLGKNSNDTALNGPEAMGLLQKDGCTEVHFSRHRRSPDLLMLNWAAEPAWRIFANGARGL
jgi:hypothetical protein